MAERDAQPRGEEVKMPISRRMFDAMNPRERDEFIKGGGWLTDDETTTVPVPRRQRSTISRERFDLLGDSEKRQLVEEGILVAD
jgi:hypothetical protein